MDKEEVFRMLQEIRCLVDGITALLISHDVELLQKHEAAIRNFIGQRLSVRDGHTMPSWMIWLAFAKWWRENNPGSILPTQKRLGMALRAAGFRKVKRGGKIVYVNAAETI